VTPPKLRDAQRWSTVFWKLLLLLGLIEALAGVYTLARGPFSLVIGPLPIRSTDGWKALTLGVWGLAAGAWLRDRLGRQRLDSATRTLHHWTIGALVAFQVMFVLPIALPGFTAGHDATAHLTNSFLFHRALEQGQFPVRWVEWISPGNGQPLFNYYQVGFYYLVQIVQVAVASLTTAVKLTLVLVWTAGAIFFFRLLHRHGFFAAASGVVLFSSSTYILLDAYVRSAMPELTAIVCVVGLLGTTTELTSSPRPSVALLHAALVGLMLTSHLPTAVVVAPVLVGYALLGVLRAGSRGLPAIVGATALGAGLAAFYVLPAIGELNFVNIGAMTNGDFDYHQYFVAPRQWFNTAWGYAPLNVGAQDPISLQIAPIQWIGAALALVMIARPRVPERGERLELAFWLLVFAGGAFMTTRWSLPVWEALPPLAFLQFPWRFLMLPALASTVMLGFAMSRLSRESTRALAFVSIALFQLQMTHDYRAMAASNGTLHADVESDAWWTVDANGRSLAFRQRAYDPIGKSAQAGPVRDRWSVIDGAASARVVESRDADTTAVVDASEPSVVRVAIPYFPGWHTYLDRVEVPSVRTPEGFIGVAVPEGRHAVEARFTSTPIRLAGNGISAAAGASWILLLVAVVARRATRGRGRSAGTDFWLPRTDLRVQHPGPTDSRLQTESPGPRRRPRV
jgi:hypothetical protein